ncbi:hypothetical protein ACFX15_016150 [Malus domestica]
MMRSPLLCRADPGLSSSSSDFKLRPWTSVSLVDSEKERVSVVMFFIPKYEADIGPLRSLVSPQNPPLFKRIGTEKYVNDFFSRHRLDGKSYLEQMKIQNV